MKRREFITLLGGAVAGWPLPRTKRAQSPDDLASVVGRAHARQMDEGTRQKWIGELGRNRSKSLDAPSWLWLSVVSLMASHEAAYLEHCRRYAIDQAA
jgi:uncharacterized protein (DUF2252 family)